jgi:hypothetical protein
MLLFFEFLLIILRFINISGLGFWDGGIFGMGMGTLVSPD